MRIIFAYFDFDGMYGMDECNLNLSTTEKFSVRRETEGVYTLSHEKKPDEEQIPNGFWGNKRLYNITAIVGDNGAGKSSLLHSLIKAVIQGLHPGVPFLLIFQATGKDGNPESGRFKLFGRDRTGNDRISVKISEGLDTIFFDTDSTPYPIDFLKVKAILIDNSLSVASIELEKAYMEWIIGTNELSRHKQCFWQLYNKSLAASVRHSTTISFGGRSSDNISPLESLSVYFRYECFQELRVLFDRSHWDLLNSLRKKGLPVPSPRYVNVFVENAYQIWHNYYAKQKMTWITVDDCPPHDFLRKVYVGLLLSIFNEISRQCAHTQEVGDIVQVFYREYGCLSEINIQLKDVRRALEIWDKLESMGLLKDTGSKKDDFTEFVDFLEQECDTLNRVFLPCQSSETGFSSIGENEWEDISGRFRINIEDTLADKEKRGCLMDFLQKYRKTSDYIYYISFSAGLSSGEMNVLRMLTQLRYALASPESGFADYRGTEKDDESYHNALRNLFPDQAPKMCDSLLLFLDEADLTFHPEWQRQLVYILAEYIPSLYKSQYYRGSKQGCKDIQVILATHSPLLLSDIPLQSCIFLKKTGGRVAVEENLAIQQTFGANIHDLLKNAFFTTRTIGERAYRQIVKMFDDLKKLEQNPQDAKLMKQCKPYIDTIRLLGDPIIKNKMLSQYRICFPAEPVLREVLSTISMITKTRDRLSTQEKEKAICEFKKAVEELSK